MKHVYFGKLPVGAEFLHKDKAYRKTALEYAVDMDGKQWVMEPHYGTVITLTQFDKYWLTNADIRE